MVESSAASFVVSLGGDGRVVAKGPVATVLEEDERFARELEEVESDVEEEDGEGASASAMVVVDEGVEVGRVSWSACEQFFTSMYPRLARSLTASLTVGMYLAAMGGK